VNRNRERYRPKGRGKKQKTCPNGHVYLSGQGCVVCARARSNERRRAASRARRRALPETKTCRRGHTYKPGKGCYQCQLAYYAERRRADPEWRARANERGRKYEQRRYALDAEHRERRKARAKQKWWSDEEHREKAKSSAKERKKQYRSDPAFRAAQVRAERVRLDAIYEDAGRHAAHREKQRWRNHIRRARVAGTDSPGVTKEEWAAICARFANDCDETICAYCKSRLADTIDHVVPIARGGRDAPDNVVPACKSCNSSKNAKLLSEWRQTAAL
jgi:5-methylcytosine-specific restriction endonuclease McrA